MNSAVFRRRLEIATEMDKRQRDGDKEKGCLELCSSKVRQDFLFIVYCMHQHKNTQCAHYMRTQACYTLPKCGSDMLNQLQYTSFRD